MTNTDPALKCTISYCKLRALFEVKEARVCRSHLPAAVEQNVDTAREVTVKLLQDRSKDYERGYAAGRNSALKELEAGS